MWKAIPPRVKKERGVKISHVKGALKSMIERKVVAKERRAKPTDRITAKMWQPKDEVYSLIQGTTVMT